MRDLQQFRNRERKPYTNSYLQMCSKKELVSIVRQLEDEYNWLAQCNVRQEKQLKALCENFHISTVEYLEVAKEVQSKDMRGGHISQI